MPQEEAVKLSYPHYLASQSFSKKFIRQYFTTSNIIKGFFIGFLLSAFILLEFFQLDLWLLSLTFAVCGVTYLLSEKKEVFFWSGFFIGVFWFYWISFSFIHYGFSYLLPLVVLSVGVIYGFLFWLMAIIYDNVFIKGGMLFCITSFVHPFGFNWLDFRLLLLDTPFFVDYLSLAIFILLCASLTCKGFLKLLSIFFLGFLLYMIPQNKPIKKLPFSFKLSQTNIAQGDKWKEEFRVLHVEKSLELIDEAIKKKNRVIFLPESAFPLYLNRIDSVVEVLMEKSQDIAIVAGALTYINDKFYNSTYVFDKGKMQMLHKVILVPFGEEIPLPRFAKNFINDMFYGGAEDFSTASMPQDFTIDNVKIRNAICFEATTATLFQNKPDFMVALSNNAWFTPSTQPVLQNLLLKLYATLNHTTIYHSINGAKSEVIFPKIYSQFKLQ